MMSSLHALSLGSKFLRSKSRRIHPLLSMRLKSQSIGLDKEQDECHAEESLSIQLAQAFEEKESDGIQDLIRENACLLRETSPRNLLLASIEATPNKIGDTASIMNSLIASCVNFKDPSVNQSRKALELLEIMEESKDAIGVDIRPDIVSYCCAFSACLSFSYLQNQEMSHGISAEAKAILERIQRLSKKQAGSKRRKAINATKRKANRADSNASQTNSRSNIDALRKQYNFDILFEDANFIGVSKPSSMICYHRHKTTKGKHEDISLEDVLTKYIQINGDTLSTLNPEGLGIVHRLDRGTSGCILIAKNDAAHALLLTAFFKREVKKSYLALIPAKAQEENANLPIDLLTVGNSGFIDLPVDGKPALSSYTVEQIHSSPPEAVTVRLDTFTGRKHQVRVHCAIGLHRPLFLEPLYKSDGTIHNKKQKNEKLDSITMSALPKPVKNVGSNAPLGHRFFLHAQSMKVPFLGIDMMAPLPQWWTDTTSELS